MSGWLSAHLCFDGGVYTAECDDLIRDVVGPLVTRSRGDGLASRAFFIRYSEGGPHVRLRMLPTVPPHGERLARLINETWSSYRSVLPPRAPREELIAWIDYKPELARYGGPHAIGLAEQLFGASSVLALETVTPEVSTDRSSRVGRAMLATLTALHVLARQRRSATEFARTYGRSYLASQLPGSAERQALIRRFDAALDSEVEPLREYLEYAWAQLEQADSLTVPLDRYREALWEYRRSIEILIRKSQVVGYGGPIRSWDAAGRYLGSSMIHMTNNRLGVSIAEESYIALAIHRVLHVS